MLALQVQGSFLEKVIESIKDLVPEATFDCSASGISLKAMYSDHVALVELLLRAEVFQHYRCDKNISLGINIVNMEKIIKCAGNDDDVTLTAADDGSDTITFMILNPQQGKIADFKMKLMDTDSHRPGIPEAEYQAIVRMSSAMFAKICKDFSAFGDTVVISVSNEGIKFSTEVGGTILLQHNIDLDKPINNTIIEMKEPVSLTFAVRYLNSFTKATPLSEIVTISLSSELPVVVEYEMSGKAYVRFYLAPRMDF